MINQNEPHGILSTLHRHREVTRYEASETIHNMGKLGTRRSKRRGTPTNRQDKKLGWSCLWKNLAFNNYRFTPYQLVKGTNPDHERRRTQEARENPAVDKTKDDDDREVGKGEIRAGKTKDDNKKVDQRTEKRIAEESTRNNDP